MPKRGTKRSRTSWLARRRAKRARTSSRYFNKRVKNTVNRMTETKEKWLDVVEHPLTTTVGCVFYDPMQLNQGDQVFQRDGVSINPTGLHIKGRFHNNGAETGYVRMIVFKATAHNDFGTATDLFRSENGDAVTPNSIGVDKCIRYPLAKSKTWRVLKDKVFRLGSVNDDGGSHTKHFKWWIPLKGSITFEANTRGQDNCYPRYHIGFFFSESDSDNIGQTCEISFLSRFFYKDL